MAMTIVFTDTSLKCLAEVIARRNRFQKRKSIVLRMATVLESFRALRVAFFRLRVIRDFPEEKWSHIVPGPGKLKGPMNFEKKRVDLKIRR